MKALITGGAGTMGSSLVTHLLENEFDVRVLDISPDKIQGTKHPNLEILKGSITDQDTVKTGVKDVDLIYHLAESFSPDPYVCLETDIRGCMNLLSSAAQAGVRHFMFVSSHRVYGRPRQIPVDEDHVLHPDESGRPLYGAVKVGNEKLCLAWYRQYNLPTSIFRPWWSFYPAIRGKIIRNMIDTAIHHDIIYVPDKTGGHFIHNDDAALCLRMAALNNKTFGEAFNLTSGVYITWAELAEMVVDLCGKGRVELISGTRMEKDPLGGSDESVYYECRMNGQKAKDLIGYASQFSPDELRAQLRATISRLIEMRKK